MEIETLLARGAECLRAYLARHWPRERDRPMGAGALHCVILSDYVQHTETCTRFVIDHEPTHAETFRSLHILSEDGEIVLLLQTSQRHRVPNREAMPR